MREWYGKKARTPKGDCGIRALAIAAQLEYGEALVLLKCAHRSWKPKRINDNSVGWWLTYQLADPREGTYREAMEICLCRLGFGRGRPEMESIAPGKSQPDFCMSTLPAGESLVVYLPGHFCAVVDGVIYDTWNCGITKKGKPRKYLHFWSKEPAR